MQDSSVKLLSMTGEAAVLVSGGRVRYANAEARAVLGENCEGKRVAELFGETVSGVQAPSFLAQIRIGKRSYLLRIARLESEQIYFLRPQETPPALLNQPFLYALRVALMNMELAADQMRGEAESLGSAKLLDTLRSITRSQYQIQRILGNASLILSCSEGDPLFAPQFFNLSALCASTVEAVGGLLPQIRFSYRGGDSVMIYADPVLVKSLLLNLLSNAIRHGRPSRVSLSLLESERSVVLGVDDDGEGIAPEELPRVFDRYRFSFDLPQMGRGPGMGLTAARLIAQLHGGALLLESRPGQGTTLRISLHREGSEQLHAPAARDPVFCQTRDLLMGLADCLPESCFSELWLD